MLTLLLGVAPDRAWAGTEEERQEPADASGPGPEDAARAADAVLDAHCTDVAGGGATASAEALVLVGPVLAEVSRSYDETGALFLLFWRGRLTACIGQEDRAIEDLGDFVAAAGALPEYADQVRDSRHRLRRLGVAPSLEAPDPGATLLFAAGGATLATGLGLSIGSYRTGDRLYPGLSTPAGWDAYTTAHTGERVGVAVVAVGTAMITAGLVKLLVESAPPKSLARQEEWRRRCAPPVGLSPSSLLGTGHRAPGGG